MTKKITFEAAMTRLEEILHTLENGSESLDASLKLYEEGVSLIRSCSSILENAEQSVKILQFHDNNVSLVDFAKSEDVQ